MLCSVRFKASSALARLVPGLLKLPFEEEPSLRGFRNGEMLGQAAKLVDIAVGKSPPRGANRDHRRKFGSGHVLATPVDGCVAFKSLARAGEIALMIFVHQMILLHSWRPPRCGFFQHGDEHIVGVLGVPDHRRPAPQYLPDSLALARPTQRSLKNPVAEATGLPWQCNG